MLLIVFSVSICEKRVRVCIQHFCIHTSTLLFFHLFLYFSRRLLASRFSFSFLRSRSIRTLLLFHSIYIISTNRNTLTHARTHIWFKRARVSISACMSVCHDVCLYYLTFFDYFMCFHLHWTSICPNVRRARSHVFVWINEYASDRASSLCLSSDEWLKWVCVWLHITSFQQNI